jgi:two-component system nitrogen regulation response regulator NtrX
VIVLEEDMETQEKAKVLIVDDEGPIRQVLSATLQDEGYEVRTAENGESGLAMMREFQPEVVLLDIWMPGRLDGIAVLSEARKEFPQIHIVMMSGHGTIETAVRATRLGAWDFIEKPLSMDKIIVTLQNLLAYRSEKNEKMMLLNRLRKNIAILGEAAPMLALKQMIARVAPTENWVFIQGELGSGKELVAQNVHYLSSRAGRVFVEFSVNATSPELLEAELFGYEKGFFPGADKTRRGRLELAHMGTLYIDEIADLSEVAQAHLLKFIQDKSLRRLGGTETIEVDVRIVAATSKNLEEEVRQARWSRELYERLAMVTLKIPALRERAGDVPGLLSHFADQFIREGKTVRKSFSASALKCLQEYSWPGNVSELRNFVERVYILTPGEFVDVHDLRFAGLMVDVPNTIPGEDAGTFREARAEFEKQYLIRKINENGGNITRTAEIIGLERSYLHRKIKSYGIDVKGE